VQTGTFYLKNK